MNKLTEIFKIAALHRQRINLALQHIQHLFPINAKLITAMQDNDLVWLELLVSRFGKLQDLLGSKLIDAFLDNKQENLDNLSMLDKIHKLERLGIITSAEIWKQMRTVRNHIAHEYPDAPELTAKYLNQIYELTPQLLDLLAKISSSIG